MKKALLLIMVCFCMIILCACGGQPAEEATEQEEAAEQAAEPATDNTANSDSSYVVELLDAQKLTNYEGKEVFTVFYSFTNNSEETVSAAVALYIKAFQDGVELEKGYLAENDLPAEKAATYDADWKDIRPGTTLECYEEFILTSTSEVEVEVTEFMSFDNAILAAKSYAVQ